MKKCLYVVVRKDLAPGLQMAQACHAVREFTREHPKEDVGDNLVALNASGLEIMGFCQHADFHRLPWTVFSEPDLAHQVTAACFSGEMARELSSLPLALRGARFSPAGDVIVSGYQFLTA